MRILIVDDEVNMIKTLGAVLRREGYEIRGVTSAEDALETLRNEAPFDLVISDVKMGGMSGLELLRRMRDTGDETPVILMTAYGAIEDAVKAIQTGASDYVTKPFPMEEIKVKIARIMEMRLLKETKEQLSRENILLKEQLDRRMSARPISEDPAMAAVWDLVDKVADQRTTVLITGESGTGKEVVAREIHRRGNRKEHPFVPVHCAALAPSLLESELFGHEKGAFTGAVKRRSGRFETAHRGTIFLDEVGEIPPDIQIKLLRVLQFQEFERVGGEKPIRVDVRVITATNRNLEELIRTGRFREDLYYRLNIIRIHIPPLRERPRDILPLARHFLNKLSRETNKTFKGFTPEAESALLTYHWPGNVRELENAVERAVVLESGDVITPAYLPRPQPAALDREPIATPEPHTGALAATEKELIESLLAQTGGNRAETARRLGIGRSTLWRKMKKYGLA